MPPYDVYLQLRDRLTIIPDKAQHKLVWGALGNPGVVLSDGEILGIWRPQKKGQRLLLTVTELQPVPPNVRAEIEAEATLFGPFRKSKAVEIEFKPV